MLMQWSYVWAVVLTGLIVVFLGLVILIAFVTLFGKVFTSSKNKNKQEPSKQEPITVQAVTPTPDISDEIVETGDDEVIAVISAAIMAMSLNDGTTYKIKSIKALNNNSRSRRPVWATAGLRDNTNPF